MKQLKLSLIGFFSALAVCGAETKPYWFEVEYLQSNGRQYVDTGVKAATNVTTTVSYAYLGLVPGSERLDMIGGARSKAGNVSRYYPVSLLGGVCKERYVFGHPTFTRDFPRATRREVVFNDAARRVWVDGTCVGTFTNAYQEIDRTMLIFAANSEKGADWFSASRIWRYAIARAGKPVRDFVPVVDFSGEPCFYDRVSGALFRNAGRGRLTAGPIRSSEISFNLAGRGDLKDGLCVLPCFITPPAMTRYVLDAETAKTYDLAVRPNGICLVAKDATAATTAVWTGAAHDGNPENPANWCCRNATGQVLTGTVPCDRTVIEVTGETTLQAPTNRNLAFATLVLKGPITLAADCDWRAFGPLTLPATLDRKGHKLYHE